MLVKTKSIAKNKSAHTGDVCVCGKLYLVLLYYYYYIAYSVLS